MEANDLLEKNPAILENRTNNKPEPDPLSSLLNVTLPPPALSGSGTPGRRRSSSTCTTVQSSQSWRRRKFQQQPPQVNQDFPAHIRRISDLNVRSGGATTKVFFKTLRRLGGFADRSKSWSELLFPKGTSLDEDRAKYWNRLQVMFDRCQGCELLKCDHVFSFGASYLRRADTDGVDESWAEQVFGRHALKEEAERDSVKRILMVLEEDLDLDVAPTFVDLVCILSLYLSEIQVYAACRRLAAVNSSTITFLKNSRRDTFSPRKVLPQTFISQSVIHLTFIECLKLADAHLAMAIEPWVDQVKVWFERFLLPLLPMTYVVALVDLLIAGDDYKLLLRVCYSALHICRTELLESFRMNKDNHDPTGIVSRHFAKVLPSLPILLRSHYGFPWIMKRTIPTRKTLISIESSMVRRCGRAPIKDAIAHVARDAFASSTTILTFAAASRMVKYIPPQYRHTCLRMRSIFQSEIGPMADQTLTSLYQACESEKNCVHILVVAAKVPKGESDLREKQFDENLRTESTAFSHPLVKDANYVVFGVFSPAPLQPVLSRASSMLRVNEHETVGDENAFVFRVAPSKAAKKWPNVSGASSIVVCLKSGIIVGKATTFRQQMSSPALSAAGSPGSFGSPGSPGSPGSIGSLGSDPSAAGQAEDAPFQVEELERSFRKKRNKRERSHRDQVVGPAVYIDHGLDHGYSGYSDTFRNEPLCAMSSAEREIDYEKNPTARTHHYYFNIFAVEVFALPKV